MKIHNLTYKDTIQKWEVLNIDFFNLTLLVGISGVGKTQILNSILRMKSIASGKSLNGVEWKISFTNENKNYTWEGKFDSIENHQDHFSALLFEEEDIVQPKIIYETIYLNEELISKRENNDIEFLNNKMPKLSSEESLLSIFKEEDSIKFAYEGFRKIVFRDHTEKEGTFSLFRFSEIEKYTSKYKTLEEIRNSDLNTIQKLHCLFTNSEDEFNVIVENYKDVFPQIDDVKVAPIEGENVHSLIRRLPIIQFKEQYVEKWITQNEMSSGMLRTFLHISEMFLFSKGTVILIDEFENSLGVNCINVLTEDLVFENSRLQFIATSHHPYIINKIPYKYWKIVTRKGGQIKTHDANDFDLGSSNHERFLNLVNLPQYKYGIESLT
jgi:predicted ATPase